MAEELTPPESRGYSPWVLRILEVWPTLPAADRDRERWLLHHAITLEQRVRRLTAMLETRAAAKVITSAVPEKLQYVLGAQPAGDPLDPDLPNGPDEVDERFAAKVDADAAEEVADSLAQERLRRRLRLRAQAELREERELRRELDPDSVDPPSLPEELT